MAKKRTSRRKKRPGFPRKSKDLNRITLRIRQDLYDAMNLACERNDVTQREFIEQGVQSVLSDTDPISIGAQSANGVARTGLWIDPLLVRAMDKRIVKDRTTQRAFMERAVESMLRQ